MNLDLIDFSWFVDSEGYSFDPNGKGLGTRLITGAGTIVRNGGKLRHYNASDLPLGLHRVFASVDKTEQAALNFVQQYGFLEDTADEHEKEEEALTTFFDYQEKIHVAVKGIHLFQDNPKHAQFIYNGFSSPHMTARFNIENNRPVLQMVPNSLMSYIWLSLADEITEGRNYQFCNNCSQPFATGGNTGHTKRKKYCSNKCKQASYRKKKEEA